MADPELATTSTPRRVRKRGPYILYNKDSSIPLPKVYSWRIRNDVERQILEGKN